MTFQTFRFSESKADWLALPNVYAISVLRVLIIAFFLMAAVGIRAQESSRMEALIGQSLSKVQQPTPEALLNCIAELKRIDAMFPDSVQPKYQMALQSLNFSVMNPHAAQTENLLAETAQTITKMEQMKNADQSDLCTLRGFLYMTRIVQNPAQNGQRYYLDVMQNFEKALKLNPENQLAKQLQQKFFEGMKQAQKR
jgi:type III secretory pathway component EscR